MNEVWISSQRDFACVLIHNAFTPSPSMYNSLVLLQKTLLLASRYFLSSWVFSCIYSTPLYRYHFKLQNSPLVVNQQFEKSLQTVLSGGTHPGQWSLCPPVPMRASGTCSSNFVSSASRHCEQLDSELGLMFSPRLWDFLLCHFIMVLWGGLWQSMTWLSSELAFPEVPSLKLFCGREVCYNSCRKTASLHLSLFYLVSYVARHGT